MPESRLTRDQQQVAKRRRRLEPYRWSALVAANGSTQPMGYPWLDGDAILEPDGFAYPRCDNASDYLEEQPLGRWYAMIPYGNPGDEWIVRRDKLNDVRAIEALRWRSVQRVAEARIAHSVVYDEAKTLGRIWSRYRTGCYGRVREESFIVWGRGQGGHRISPKEMLKDRDSDNAIDRLAVLPTPQEEEVGERYDETGRRLDLARKRQHMLNEVLGKAMTISGRVMPERDPETWRHRHQNFRCTINGRLYITVPTERGIETRRIWPDVDDVAVDFDKE